MGIDSSQVFITCIASGIIIDIKLIITVITRSTSYTEVSLTVLSYLIARILVHCIIHHFILGFWLIDPFNPVYGRLVVCIWIIINVTCFPLIASSGPVV